MKFVCQLVMIGKMDMIYSLANNSTWQETGWWYSGVRIHLQLSYCNLNQLSLIPNLLVYVIFFQSCFWNWKKYRAIKKGSEEKDRRSFMYIAKLYWLIPESVERFKLYSLLLLCSMLDFQCFKGIWFAFPFQQWARQPTCRCDSFLFSNIFLII